MLEGQHQHPTNVLVYRKSESGVANFAFKACRSENSHLLGSSAGLDLDSTRSTYVSILCWRLPTKKTPIMAELSILGSSPSPARLQRSRCRAIGSPGGLSRLEVKLPHIRLLTKPAADDVLKRSPSCIPPRRKSRSKDE